MPEPPGLPVVIVMAMVTALGMCLVILGFLRWRHRAAIRRRVAALARGWHAEENRLPSTAPASRPPTSSVRVFADRVGRRLARQLPGEVAALAAPADRAGVAGGIQAVGFPASSANVAAVDCNLFVP